MRSAFSGKDRGRPTSGQPPSKYRRCGPGLRKKKASKSGDGHPKKSARRLELESQLAKIGPPSPISYYDRWTDEELEQRLEALWHDELPVSLERGKLGSDDTEWLRKRAARFGWIDLHSEHTDRCIKDAEVDPITLLPLDGPIFEFHISDSATVRYNLSSICEYLLTSGNFTEPTSRKALTIEDVRRLDQQAKSAGLELPKTIESAFQSPDHYKAKNQMQVMLEGLDRCVGEVVCEMLACIENCRHIEEGQILLLGLSAQFDFLFAQLKHTDASFAAQCLDQYKALLCGPPNKRTPDNGGLLSVSLDMLSAQRVV